MNSLIHSSEDQLIKLHEADPLAYETRKTGKMADRHGQKLGLVTEQSQKTCASFIILQQIMLRYVNGVDGVTVLSRLFLFSFSFFLLSS